MQKTIKTLTKLFILILTPSLVMILILLGLSLIGVYLEKDIYLLLKLGFDNLTVAVSIFLLANILTWGTIEFFIKPYNKIFFHGIKSLLIVFAVILFMHLNLILYYQVILYYLTSLLFFEIKLIFSQDMKQKAYILLITLSIIISIVATIGNVLIYYFNKEKISSPKSDTVKKDTPDQEVTNSNSFDDMIAS